jgi:hypothetical protein
MSTDGDEIIEIIGNNFGQLVVANKSGIDYF